MATNNGWLGYVIARLQVFGGGTMATEASADQWMIWCQDCDVLVLSGTGARPTAEEIRSAHPHPMVAQHLREGTGQPHTLSVRGRITEG